MILCWISSAGSHCFSCERLEIILPPPLCGSLGKHPSVSFTVPTQTSRGEAVQAQRHFPLLTWELFVSPPPCSLSVRVEKFCKGFHSSLVSFHAACGSDLGGGRGVWRGILGPDKTPSPQRSPSTHMMTTCSNLGWKATF